MGAYGVSVEKEFTFRGQPELTSNVYHYHLDVATDTAINNLADAVVLRDKAAHTADFAYKTVRVFGPTEGSKADNVMKLVKDISGNGSRSAVGPNIYPELTACVSIFVGRSPVKNRKVFVRKFIHLNILQSSSSSATSGLLATAEKTFWTGWMEANRAISSGGGTVNMCTPKDVDVPDNSAVCLNYARIRQLHQ